MPNYERRVGTEVPDYKRRVEMLESRSLLAASPVLSEFMAEAVGGQSHTLLDGDRQASDWIEIRNAGDSAANLEGWYLTDDPDNPNKWQLPRVLIEPDGYAVVFASGKDRKSESHRLVSDFHGVGDATFRVDLPAGDYSLRLLMGDIDRVRDDMAVYVQGALVDTVTADAGVFEARTFPAEILADGVLRVRIADLGGQTGRAVINALEVVSEQTGDAWNYDFGTPTSLVEPGFIGIIDTERYQAGVGYGWESADVVAGQDRGLPNNLHTNFQLDVLGEYLALVSPEGEVVSELEPGGRSYPAQVPGISYGVVPGEGPLSEPRVGYMPTPTPGSANFALDAIVGPRISDVTDGVDAIDDDEDLVIEARVESGDVEVDSVALVYRVMFGEEVRLTMLDGGTGSDTVAGDGYYTAAIPHTAAGPGEMVRWAVEAVDVAGFGSRAPLAAGVQHNAGMFTVRESFDSGSIEPLQPILGAWSVADGRLLGAANPGEDALSTIADFSPVTGKFEVRATFRFSQSEGAVPHGAVIFDYHSPTDFKFAAFDSVNSPQIRGLIGQRTADGWQVLIERVWLIDLTKEHTARVTVDGSLVTLIGDGVVAVAYTFAEPLRGGMVGLGSQGGTVLFDDLVVTPLALADVESREYFGTIVDDSSIDSQLPVLHWFAEDINAVQLPSGGSSSMFFNGRFYDNIDVDRHGQSTGGFPKRSFDVDLNPGLGFVFSEAYAPVTDFNLLTNYADKTKVRNTLAYETYRDAGHEYHIAFPIRVERNGDFYAIQDWLDEGGEEYLERLGLDPNGSLYKVNNALNNAYNDVEKRTRRHDVPNTRQDHSDLEELVSVRLLPEAERNAWYFDRLDLASWANFLAVMAVNGNIDCCHKNYYVYHDIEGTGQWKILPWDQDLSFGHNWNGEETYFDDDLIFNTGLGIGNEFIGGFSPASGLYAAPGFREMFLRRVRTLLDQLMQPPGTPRDELKYEARVDQIIELLGTDGALDQAEWGFNSNMSPQSPREAADDLIDFYFPQRREFLYNSIPEIPAAQQGTPRIDFGVIEAVPLSGNLDEQFIELVNPNDVAVDLSGWQLTGDVRHSFRAGTVIPAGGSLYLVADVRAFRARADGPRGGQNLFVQGEFDGRLPAGESTLLLVPLGGQPSAQQEHLRIAELNYNPYEPIRSAGDLGVDHNEFEFIELVNTGSGPLELEGVRIDDGIQFEFGPYSLAAGERVLVVKNQQAFVSRYGDTLPIAGQFASGSLNSSGEWLRLVDRWGQTIEHFAYSDGGDWPGRADGRGSTLEIVDPLADPADPGNWRSSSEFGGSPGRAAAANVSDVVVNEVLTRGADGEADQIELHNTTGEPIDISGWLLSDDGDDLAAYRVPSDTVLASGDYIVFTSNQTGFGLSGTRGDSVWLVAADPVTRRPLRFVDHVEFGATPTGVTLGRWPNGNPEPLLFPMEEKTLGEANTGPQAPNVILSEVHYNPPALAYVDESFSEGTLGAFRSVSGNWSAVNGRLVVDPSGGTDAIAIPPSLDRLPTRFRVGATIRLLPDRSIERDGAILFDYRGPEDFKFAQFLTVPDALPLDSGFIILGQRDASGWHALSSIPLTITGDFDHVVMLEVDGSTAVFGRGPLKLGRYDFGEPLNTGTIGLGSQSGQASFDRVLVHSLADRQDQEFIELTNVSDQTVDLSGWRLTGGVDYVIPAGTMLEPHASLVVVGLYWGEDARTENVRRMLAVDPSVRVLGPFVGQLDNGGEQVQLVRPLTPGGTGPGFVLVDATSFDDREPWPVSADGQGKSLVRRAADAYGPAAASWLGAVPTVGSAYFAAVGDMNRDGRVDADDIGSLVLALADPSAYESTYAMPAALAGDADGDGDLDYDDLNDLVRLIQTGSVSAAAEEPRSGGGVVEEAPTDAVPAATVRPVAAAKRTSKRVR